MSRSGTVVASLCRLSPIDDGAPNNTSAQKGDLQKATKHTNTQESMRVESGLNRYIFTGVKGCLFSDNSHFPLLSLPSTHYSRLLLLLVLVLVDPSCYSLLPDVPHDTLHMARYEKAIHIAHCTTNTHSTIGFQPKHLAQSFSPNI